MSAAAVARSPPPVTATTICRRRLVTISSTVGAVHLLRPPQLLPVRLCQSLPPQPYALDVSNRVREGLVIASRRRRPTRGPSRGLASSSSSSSPSPSPSDHCDGHYDMIIAGGGAFGSALVRMLLNDTTAASPGGGGAPRASHHFHPLPPPSSQSRVQSLNDSLVRPWGADRRQQWRRGNDETTPTTTSPSLRRSRHRCPDDVSPGI